MAEEDKKKSLLELIGEWPLQRKLSLGGVILLSLIFFGVIIAQTRTADYRLLFANLSSSDAATIVEKLKEQKIEYRLQDGGSSIFIPAEAVYEVRLNLAGSNLPQGGGVGFEIFDRQSFGMTEFAQKVNYRRALQGELARTIASLGPVQNARVHLAIPEKRLFREQQQDATASVILQLAGRSELRNDQIQGIINLVAGSIEGLRAENVSVIDSSGRVLSKNSREVVEGLEPGRLEYQLAVERSLEQRAQSLLDRALGPGNSLVQVTAKLDFSQRERVEETYDPDGSVVRSEQSSQEKSGQESVGGVPGVESNLGDGGMQSSSVVPSKRSEETVNYEVSKVVSKLVAPVGVVENISVAVLVSDRLDTAEGGESVFTPRPEAELQAIEKMVRSALGLDEERGDQIAVVARPFEPAVFADNLPEPTSSPSLYYWMPLIKYGLITLGGALLYFLLIRPMVRTLRGEGKRVEHYKTVEEIQSELEGQQPLALGPGNVDESVKKLRQEIMQSKNSPTQVIKTWLRED